MAERPWWLNCDVVETDTRPSTRLAEVATTPKIFTPPHLLGLLRPRRERPRCRRASEKRDECAPAAHSITSSAHPGRAHVCITATRSGRGQSDFTIARSAHRRRRQQEQSDGLRAEHAAPHNRRSAVSAHRICGFDSGARLR